MKNVNQLIGCCGLDCEKCDARIAKITNNNALREKTAVLWTKLNGVTILPEMINCTGCRIEGAKTPFCDKLCPVHNCVREKGLDHCGQCGDFPCPKLGKMGDFRDLDTGRVKERTCRAVAAEGLPAWLAEYEEKADLLTVALERYNNGRMKRYLCELFLQQDLDTLRRIMARAEALEGADSKELGRAFQALVGEILES